MDYQYDITYGFDGWDGLYADSPAIGKWLNNVYRPRQMRRSRPNGHIPGPLIFMRDDGDLSKGTDLNAFRAALQPRLWRPAALADRAGREPLAEAIPPARARTYVLLEATLEALASDGKVAVLRPPSRQIRSRIASRRRWQRQLEGESRAGARGSTS